MIKVFFSLLIVVSAWLPADVVLAQGAPGGPSATQGGAGIRGNNITSTGETVPNPGVSQGAGVTPLDRGVYREDNKISNGICKGC